MHGDDAGLPASVRIAEVPGKRIYLVGTAHVSKESVLDVRRTVEKVKPDAICVELCEGRYQALARRDAWRRMDIFKIIKEKKALFLLIQLIMTAFYRRIGEKLGVEPGAEMLEGIRQAEANGARLVLADRDIQVTLKRIWGHLNCWNKMKMMAQLAGSLFTSGGIDEGLIEEMKQHDQLENVLKIFAETFPHVKERLLDERDIYLAQKIREAPGDTVVAVVGAAHLPGIERNVGREIPLAPLTETPPPSKIGPILKWVIPSLIVVLLILGFFKGGAQQSVESIYIWILINGSLSALGAAAALAHPLTILASFVGAPITSLNPMIAAGWVAGLVQAWVKRPTVMDLEDLPKAISTVRGFWLNPVSRILLVVVLANAGSALGTFVAGSWIAMRAF